MPIEIRELIIRTQITDEGAERQKLVGKRQHLNEHEIIERCVEKILRKLNKKRER